MSLYKPYWWDFQKFLLTRADFTEVCDLLKPSRDQFKHRMTGGGWRGGKWRKFWKLCFVPVHLLNILLYFRNRVRKATFIFWAAINAEARDKCEGCDSSWWMHSDCSFLMEQKWCDVVKKNNKFLKNSDNYTRLQSQSASIYTEICRLFKICIPPDWGISWWGAFLLSL